MIDLVCNKLIDRNITISAAESFTGGRVSSALVSRPGISSVFLCGTVAYTDGAKIARLNVPVEVIDKYGAVSRECALAMALGARGIAHSDIAVSTTGFAGPGGGTPEAPVGTIFIGISTNESNYAVKYVFEGSREEITCRGTEAAFAVLWEELKNK